MAVLDILEGQLAFLSTVREHEKKHAGCRLLQPPLTWKYEFLCCFLGALSAESLGSLHEEIRVVSNLRHDHGGIEDHVKASLEELQRMKLRPFEWEPRKSFAFVCANSKGRFKLWVAPKALVFNRFFDWDFEMGISAIQGHSRMPEQVSEAARWESVSSWTGASTWA
ncbi:unnamed protein product [Symbiodinium sp. CCMP2456]|nr:unnamed protein product [Symbiodinium sp. CCMP2456]